MERTSGLPYPASASFYGVYELLHRARRVLKSLKPDILFYTEPSGPLARQVVDLTYNYDEECLSGSLMTVISEKGYAGSRAAVDRRVTARDVALWLHHRRLALPPGAETVHHLDSHDTYWWGEKAQFRREAFGDAAARAMFAFFALLDGGIMVYTGAERGAEAFYQRLLRLRRGIPALRYGGCETMAVACADEAVLALLRTHEGTP